MHVASPTVSHLLKGTPLVDAADDSKLVFASSYLGRLVAHVVKEEGEYLSDWKVAKIVEAAGPAFDPKGARTSRGRRALTSSSSRSRTARGASPRKNYYEYDSVRDVEFEPLGQRGKTLRAAIAPETGRTSMPAVYVRGGRSGPPRRQARAGAPTGPEATRPGAGCCPDITHHRRTASSLGHRSASISEAEQRGGASPRSFGPCGRRAHADRRGSRTGVAFPHGPRRRRPVQGLPRRRRRRCRRRPRRRGPRRRRRPRRRRVRNFDARRGARVDAGGRGAGAGAGASENFEARGLDTSGAAEDRGDREAARLTAVAGRRCTSSVASSRTDTFSPPRWIAVTTPLRTERSGSLKRTRSPTERGARASSASPSSAA